MKNIYYLILIAICAFSSKALANLPEVSTAADPRWYYLQADGSGNNREGMVFTVVSDNVKGSQIKFTGTQDEIDNQLFRFEKGTDNAAAYTIISKSTGKKVDISGTNVVLTAEGAEFIIAPVPNTHYHNMECTKVSTSTKYIHQSKDNAYAVILTGTDYYRGNNSQYAFVPYDAVHLQYSDSSEDVFYFLKSGNPEYADKSLTDASTSSSSVNYSVETATEGNMNQQWKFVKKGDDSSLVNIVNRATGNIIQTKSDAGDFYNYLQFTKSGSESNGWQLTYYKAGRYTISGVEEDGFTRYWALTTEGEAPAKYEAGAKLTFSDFAWIVELADKQGATTISNTTENNEIIVFVQDKRIFVQDSDDYVVRTLQGMLVDKTNRLPEGVYLVSVGQKTVKVLVK